MAAVTDNFTVNIADAQGRSHQARSPVAKRCHPVINMGHRGSSVGDSQKRLIIGCGGMPQADHHAGLSAVLCQRQALVMLRRKSDIAYHPLCRLLVFLELGHGWRRDRLRRLGALVIHIEIGPFKVNSQNFSSLIALFHHFRHILESGCKYVRHLGYRSRQKRRHSLLRHPFYPVPESLRFAVICIKSIGAVGVNVYKARDDPV